MECDLEIEQPVRSGVLRAINFDILSASDAANISAKVVGVVSEVTDPALGLPNSISKCHTCGVQDPKRSSNVTDMRSKRSTKDAKECEGHFGLINLPYTIINPFFLPEVAQILNKICPGCKSVRRSRIKIAASESGQSQWKFCKYCDAKFKNYPPLKFKVSPRNIFKRTAIIAEVNEKLMKKYGLAPDFWDIIPRDAQAEGFSTLVECSKALEENLESNQRFLSHAQVHSILKEVDPVILDATFKRKSSIFLNCLLLTPNCHRIIEFRQDMLFDERNGLYKKLIDFKGTANELSIRVLDCTKITKLRVANTKANQDTISTASGLKFIKELIIGKRTDHAFRMRISRRNGELIRVTALENLQKGDMVYRPLVDGDVVLINRPPSIHQHSLIALFVKVLPLSSVLSINPLICSPLCGDFDGDCLHGFVPQSIDSKVELQELISLDKQLTNRQNGRNLLSLSHDSLTAAHLLLEGRVLLDHFQLQQLSMFCNGQGKLPVPAIIKGLSCRSCAWTGKQFFSMFLPGNFDYKFQSDSVCVSQGEVLSSSGSTWLRDRTSENLVHSLIMHCGGEALQFLNAAQDALCEWLSMRGLSISLSDLYLSDDPVTRKNLLDEISYGLREAETLSSISQMLIEDNQDFLTGAYLENEESFDFQVQQKKMNWVGQNQASISSFKRGFRDIQSLFYVYASNENSLLAMLKAGSKGNLLKAVQHSMCLGLLHASCTLGFQIPYHLTSPTRNIPEHSGPHFPCAVVENSFLTGLNPLEGFVHSLVTREGSFGGNADVSGTLTRNLMFFMRDLYIGYDGTVRNKHGNHVVQFSYASKSFSQDVVGGHPVGSLAACALSEAAYSALDQPVSILEPSPLMNLKKVLESGAKRNIGGKTASLYLSKKLVKYCNGYEYGAWEVKRHLERMLFSDIVSTVLICFSPETCRKRRSPWLCHFHINNELAKRKGIKVQSIASGLSMHCADTKAKAKFEFPKLHITCTDCSLKKEREDCISAAIDESSEESSSGYDTLRDVVKPFLLGTVIKGFSAFKKVDILWKEGPKGASGELCLQRSHPDDIQDISQTFGIDLAWNSFLNRLSSAMSDAEKDILPEHLALTTDCLSATGEFVALNAKGLADQRKACSVSAPFSLACLKNPGPVFVKASKMGSVDLLQGSAEALSWGKVPSIGTGFQFEVLYSGEGHKLAEPTDVYSQLGGIQSTLMKQNPVVDPTETIEIHRKSRDPKPRKYEDIDRERRENLLRKSISKAFSLDDIQKLSQALSNMLKAYRVDEPLKESDKSIVMKALYFHPQRDEKIGTGAREIKVGRHEKHQSPCFIVVRSDGTVEDFSYRKCVHRALELIAPDKAKAYQSKWMKGKDLPVAATGQGGRLIQP
ncbi:unnamed protein product [Cuscuta campestris]|uniref:DNA-directed RNA polymerase n=1 Tax=Cuscuta campestris TaxID=132261 RepID=A0A484NNX9_9ASTE|nr:unnamed protein product [Cuscuta campestris]